MGASFLNSRSSCSRNMAAAREARRSLRPSLSRARRPMFSALSKVSRSTATFGVLIKTEEHTSELQSLMRISYAVFCLKKKNKKLKKYQYTKTRTREYKQH